MEIQEFMPSNTQLLEPIPEGWKVARLLLPVSASNLGTWYVPARVISPEGEVVWRLLKVRGLYTPNTEINKVCGCEKDCEQFCGCASCHGE